MSNNDYVRIFARKIKKSIYCCMQLGPENTGGHRCKVQSLLKSVPFRGLHFHKVIFISKRLLKIRYKIKRAY